LVGANNSGKTAILSALKSFLTDRKFSVYDISASEWTAICDLGQRWEDWFNLPEKSDERETFPWGDDLARLVGRMPTLDLWFDAQKGAYHHVAGMIPSLSWDGGIVGVRLRLEPASDVDALRKLAMQYAQARDVVREAGNAARAWPTDLHDFLLRHPKFLGAVVTYKLKPELRGDVTEGVPTCQVLPPDARSLDGDPVKALMRVDFVSAQRGLGTDEVHAGERASSGSGLFSKQLVQFAKQHLDGVGPALDAGHAKVQVAIAQAQVSLDQTIEAALKGVTDEVSALGYPGLHDPQELHFRSRIFAAQLLDHNTAVQYDVNDPGRNAFSVPEHAIGLGYQNLQAISYRLVAFRTARCQTGDAPPAPVHLVLLEEPEAHLHVQAQRVFAQKAYPLLHSAHEVAQRLASHLLISTHSSHLAHSGNFNQLRYVRRMSSNDKVTMPSSVVLSLADVFGDDHATRRFVERYLRIQHADLLFADAAVFIEGLAERLFVPYFVERDHLDLAKCYLSYLEVGGSHAHRLRPMVERLGIPTLVITDLDPAQKSEPSTHLKGCQTALATETTNPTLTKWHPAKSLIKELLGFSAVELIAPGVGGTPGRVRMTYQLPAEVGGACGSSFEDALALENVAFFKSLGGGAMTGMLKRFCAVIEAHSDAEAQAQHLYEVLHDQFDKGAFASDLLEETLLAAENAKKAHEGGSSPPPVLRCPRYIEEGLKWLASVLKPSAAGGTT
jgi:hypothetical protein